jgi:hypothetical protein
MQTFHLNLLAFWANGNDRKICSSIDEYSCTEYTGQEEEVSSGVMERAGVHVPSAKKRQR